MTHTIKELLDVFRNSSWKIGIRNGYFPPDSSLNMFDVLLLAFMFEGESSEQQFIQAHSKREQIGFFILLVSLFYFWGQVVGFINKAAE